MSNDKIEIILPGSLPSGMSEDEYMRGYVSILRNPILANIFYRLGIIEKFGTGIKRIKYEYREYYIKNNRVYFVYQKLTATEHIIWTDNSKVLAIYELIYYFDSNGKIVRYVDEKGNIHENDSQMREEDEEIRRFKLNFLGNRL